MVGYDRKSLAMCILTVVYINMHAKLFDRITTFYLKHVLSSVCYGFVLLNFPWFARVDRGRLRTKQGLLYYCKMKMKQKN